MRALPIGAVVRLRYLPAAPGRATVDVFWERWGDTVAFGVGFAIVGGLAAAITIGMAISERWIG